MTDSPAGTPRSDRVRRRGILTRLDWPIALGVGLVATTIAAIVLRVWGGSFAVPMRYGGDPNQVMLAIQGIAEEGWWYENPRVGAPFGLEMYDFPDGGPVQFLMFKIIGWLTGGATGLTYNITYLLGYTAVAAVGYWVLRRLEVSRPWAAALGVVYALLPYHFARIGHHYLALYVAAPLTILLAVQQLLGRPAFTVEGGRKPRIGFRWQDRDTRTAVVAGLVIGTTGAYYAIFAGLILLACAGLGWAMGRDRVRAVSTILVAAVVGLALFGSLLPTISYRIAHGPNPVVEHPYGDVERYALKPLHLLLPIQNHRVPVMRAPMERAATGIRGTEAGQQLGLIGAIGLIALVVGGLGSLVAGQVRTTTRTRVLSGLALGMMLAAAIGGFGAILGVLGSTQIRAWNRISVFIGFVALAAVGSWLSRWWRGRSVLGAWVLAGVLVFIGAFDQTGPLSDTVAEERQAEWDSDARFVAEIEELLPQGAMVYQLPYVPFPGPPPVERVQPHDMLKGYLHSTDLRWSFGAMRGRVPEWQPGLVAQGPAELVDRLCAVGFDGLYIDRFGYVDSAAELEASLRELLGQAPLVSDNGRLAFFDLRPAGFALRSRLTPEAIDALARETLLVDELPQP